MDFILGQIQLFAFQFEIRGWVLCDGRLLQIMNNQALFALIGTTYGGDGHTTFAVPNLKGLAPDPHTQYFIAVEGIFPQRD
ncbi:phage tail protein [Sulfurospirillum cavolei]|uniref:phage tail protein n=1 Tax=Sulfurospirillum cavolei TaxID=366522 RepID=UPI000764A03A|nr:tail fiber protein [Sulfurospirillum cavolei]